MEGTAEAHRHQIEIWLIDVAEVGSSYSVTVEKIVKKLAKQVFHCVEDAAAASDPQVQAAHIRWHLVTPRMGFAG